MRSAAVIVGVGPQLGTALARAYGRAGYDVGLIARSAELLTAIGEQLQADGITTGWATADAADEAQLRGAVERLGRHAGRIKVLHYNLSVFRAARPTQLEPQDLLADLAAGAVNLLTAVAAARPLMASGSVVLATGSRTADRPMRSAASLGVQKAALRNLVTVLDRELRGDGIRAASVTVNGTIGSTPAFAPERISEVFVDLLAKAASGEQSWQSEVSYDG